MADSKVSKDAWRNAPYKIWILHEDRTTNNTLVVFKWPSEKQRNYMFRKAKQQLTGYKGKRIIEARFYENAPGGQMIGHMDEHGVFYDGCAFMNTL